MSPEPKPPPYPLPKYEYDPPPGCVVLFVVIGVSITAAGLIRWLTGITPIALFVFFFSQIIAIESAMDWGCFGPRPPRRLMPLFVVLQLIAALVALAMYVPRTV